MQKLFGTQLFAFFMVETIAQPLGGDRKSTRLNSSHLGISYAVFCLKKKKNIVYTSDVNYSSATAVTDRQYHTLMWIDSPSEVWCSYRTDDVHSQRLSAHCARDH